MTMKWKHECNSPDSVISIPCENSLSWTSTIFEESTRAKFWVCNVYIYQILSFFKSSEVQGKVPSGFRINWTGPLFPNSQEELAISISVFLLLILKCFLEYDVANPWHSTAWHSHVHLVVCFFAMGTGKRCPRLCSLFSLCHPVSLLRLESESSSARAHCISRAEGLLTLLL